MTPLDPPSAIAECLVRFSQHCAKSPGHKLVIAIAQGLTLGLLSRSYRERQIEYFPAHR
jgi:hypothetical protein